MGLLSFTPKPKRRFKPGVKRESTRWIDGGEGFRFKNHKNFECLMCHNKKLGRQRYIYMHTRKVVSRWGRKEPRQKGRGGETGVF